MLRSDLILPRLKIVKDQVIPLALPVDYHYLAIAQDLIRLVQSQVGYRRGELTAVLNAYEGDSVEYWIIRGLAHILESRCTFVQSSCIDPLHLRLSLFDHGPVTQKTDPFVTQTRSHVIAEVAAQLALTTQQIEETLFTDLAEEHILQTSGDLLTPVELIARYNLEVARGVLYWAKTVQITVGDGFKDLFKYIKLFKLMHTVYRQAPQDYQIILHGPISPFVKATIRYGLQFAKFLPALLLGQQWQMTAEIQLPQTRKTVYYHLDHTTALRSHFKASAPFDSQLEIDFAEEFAAKYSGAKRQWQLTREDEIIVVGDTVMIPDFSLTHRQDGRRALIEIVGFWHPHYLQRKVTKIQQAQRQDLIVLIYKSANVAEGVFENITAGEVLTFVNKPVLKEVLAAVDRCAVLPIIHKPNPGV